ncbi:hypothetical protein F8388_017782 [Cannabis sativa]|uniref:Uncharacterized protein n=1 Tax=Cannabis sativa TaxID=3483 RepID=A0A7J6E5B8_CANSA|nr:hypothetical protein F8388_017782 [Cannabis sativa]
MVQSSTLFLVLVAIVTPMVYMLLGKSYSDSFRGFYTGFGISILTYAPSMLFSGLRILLHTGSFGVVLVVVWGRRRKRRMVQSMVVVVVLGLSRATLVVQGLSAAMASGVSALITMPLDTIKTRLQVLDGEGNGQRRPLTIVQTVRNSVVECGFVNVVAATITRGCEFFGFAKAHVIRLLIKRDFLRMACKKKVTKSDLRSALEIPQCAAKLIYIHSMLSNNKMHFVVGDEDNEKTYNVDVKERNAGCDDLRYSVKKRAFKEIIDGSMLNVGDTLYFSLARNDRNHHPPFESRPQGQNAELSIICGEVKRC